jgi:hypothetical protein
MEFKKMPASAAAAVPAVDPDTQMHHALRLMAQRSLHGARGILFIAGSLLLVLGFGGLAHEPVDAAGVKSGHTVWDNLMAGRMGIDEWLSVGDIALGVVTILCGALVTRMPLTASILPALLFAGKIGGLIWVAATTKTPPALVLTVVQFALVAGTLRSLRDARAYRREAAVARDYYRNTAIRRQKEERAELAPADIPQSQRAGTKLPPPKKTAPPA